MSDYWTAFTEGAVCGYVVGGLSIIIVQWWWTL
jgi:hypothetical protein